MKIPDNFVLRNIIGEYIIVPVGQFATEFNGIISTNSTGAFLWDLLTREDLSEEELVEKMLDEYDTDEPNAREDVRLFVSELKRVGII